MRKVLTTIGLLVATACSSIDPHLGHLHTNHTYGSTNSEWGPFTLRVGTKGKAKTYSIKFDNFFKAPLPFLELKLEDYEGDGVCDRGWYKDLFDGWEQAGRGRLAPSIRNMENVAYKLLESTNQGFGRRN